VIDILGSSRVKLGIHRTHCHPVLATMLVLWFTESDQWVRTLAIVYLAWVTICLTTKVALVSYIIASRPQSGVGVLLKDTIVLWITNVLLFGAWYWIIDAGGPRVRREGPAQRSILHFPNAWLPCPDGKAGNLVSGIMRSWDFVEVHSLGWQIFCCFPCAPNFY